MRSLLILICVCNLLLVGRSLISYSATRTAHIETKSSLSYFQTTAEPVTDALITAHSEQMARLARHWREARALAVASALASVVYLGFSMKKKGKDVG